MADVDTTFLERQYIFHGFLCDRSKDGCWMLGMYPVNRNWSCVKDIYYRDGLIHMPCPVCGSPAQLILEARRLPPETPEDEAMDTLFAEIEILMGSLLTIIEKKQGQKRFYLAWNRTWHDDHPMCNVCHTKHAEPGSCLRKEDSRERRFLISGMT